ncbi:MAG: BrnT family toxin [Terracidiphilus sp.]
MGKIDPLADCTGFDWDQANAAKNWERHHVTPEETEDVFFHDPFVLRSDPAHSRHEKRYWALGKTERERRLFVVFTIRKKLIRVVSARDMSRREIEEYERYEKSDS